MNTHPPRTKEAIIKIECEDSCCGIYCYTKDGSSYHGEVCSADEMAKVENELLIARCDIQELNDRLVSFGEDHLRAAARDLDARRKVISQRKRLMEFVTSITTAKWRYIESGDMHQDAFDLIEKIKKENEDSPLTQD